jgi:hypothetical protein
MAKKKVNAEAVIADIRAHMDDDALMAKYELTSAQLGAVFKKLEAEGFITEAEIFAANDIRSAQTRFPDGLLDRESLSGGETQSAPLSTANPERSGLSKNNFFRPISTTATKLVEHVFRTLRNTDRPARSYAWRAWLISIIPTYVIGSIVVGVLDLPGPEIPISSPVFLVVFLLYFAPVVETLIMWPILWLLRLVIRGQLWVALASAVIWGVLHGLHSVAQGLTITWGFFVFSMCFMEWEKKSRLTAIGVTALVHMLHNLLPALILILVALSGEQAVEPKVQSRAPQNQEASLSVEGEIPSTKPSVPDRPAERITNLDNEEKYRAFREAFPEFGKEEFELADDDLYPDWKKNHAPDATWDDFMKVYKEFIEWWTDRGSPNESGLKSWKEFLAQRK